MLTGQKRYLPAYGLLKLSQDPLAFLQRLQQKYGDFVRVGIGPYQLFAVHDPELIREVLVTQQADFQKGRGLQVARRLIGNGLVTSEGEFHLHQRRLMQPCFQRLQLDRYREPMQRCTLERASGWADGQTLDLHREFSAIALEIICQTMFGQTVANETALVERCFRQNVSAFRAGLVPLMPWLERLPLPYFRRLLRSRQELDRVLLGLIARVREAPSDNLISLLLETGMEDRQLRDEAMTIFLAGHETTANWLSWTWLLLSQNPAVLADLLVELGRDHDPPLLRQVLQESLRLFPPAWAVGRQARVPVQLRGVTIPAGATVIMSPWVMGRDPRWFAEPEKFRPQRWTAEFERGLPKLAFFPFGAGNRVCIGEHFARLEAREILSILLRRYAFCSRGNPPLKTEARITLRPAGGVPVQVQLR